MGEVMVTVAEVEAVDMEAEMGVEGLEGDSAGDSAKGLVVAA